MNIAELKIKIIKIVVNTEDVTLLQKIHDLLVNYQAEMKDKA